MVKKEDLPQLKPLPGKYNESLDALHTIDFSRRIV
jgi:hypothetical protein